MKRLLLLFISILGIYSANAQQVEMEQVAMNNLIIISNMGNFPPYGYGNNDIKRHRFEYDDEWAIADLRLSSFKSQAVVIYKYKAVNIFGEIVPDDKPSEKQVLAYDAPQKDYYSVRVDSEYEVSVSKEDLTTMYFDIEKSWGMDHKYIIMLPDESATMIAFYLKDGSKEYDYPIAVDKDNRITLYGKESVYYDDHNHIIQYTSPIFGGTVLDWTWKDGCISQVKLNQYTTLWEKDIEVLERYENGLWKRVKVSKYQGSTKKEDKQIRDIYYLERKFFEIE